MRTIIWFIYFWLYLIATWPVYLRARYLARRGWTEAHDALVRKVTGNWARRLIALAGGQVRVEGLEHLPDGPAVYVSNHLGYFDVPLVLGYFSTVIFVSFAQQKNCFLITYFFQTKQ